MKTVLQDLRYGLRTLLRQGLFTGVAVLVLGLGIGANTAVFSVIDAVLLRPLPYPEPDRLVVLREKLPEIDAGSVALPNYLDWRAGQRSYTDLALARRESFNVSFLAGSGAAPERVSGATITANFFSILRVNPMMGRDFTEAEDTPGAPRVVLLGESLWRRRFNADHAVIGQRILVDGALTEIIGVVPAAVGFPRAAEMFSPLADLRKSENLLDRGNHASFSVLGRLKPGVTLTAARADLHGIAIELARRYPDSNVGRDVNSQFMLDYSVGEYRESLLLLLCAVGCVLLITCANVANLQLARASGREKELAVRAALGAGRWRLVRQMLTESMVLSALGGVAGVLLAMWAMDAIVALSPAKAPRFQQTHLDPAALGFTAAVALGTGILAGMWPAWRVSGAATMASAARGQRARGHRWCRSKPHPGVVGGDAGCLGGGAAHRRGPDPQEFLSDGEQTHRIQLA